MRESVARNGILAALQDRFLAPRAQQELRRIVAEELRAWARGASDEGRTLEARIAEAERQLERLVDAVAQGLDTPALRRRLRDTEERLRADRAMLGRLQAGAPVVPLPEAIAQRALDLGRLLDGAGPAGREALRALFSDGRIVMEPQSDGTYVAETAVLADVVLGMQTPAAVGSGRALYTSGCGGRI